MKQSLFISYSWKNKDIADDIQLQFEPTGLPIIRDTRTLKYKESIKEFMSRVRDTDYVLIIISDYFIKSVNCMYEVMELIKDKNFKDKILPIVVDGTKIYSTIDRLEYIKYWSDKHKELEEKIAGFSPTDLIETLKELKHIENIRRNIDEFLTYASDILVPGYSELKETGFKPIFDHIGVSNNALIKLILQASNIKDKDEKQFEINKLEAEYPHNANLYVVKGIMAYEEKKIPQSCFFYRKAIELNPSFASAYYNLAFNEEVFNDNLPEAISLYEKSIELEPSNTRAHNNLAGIYSGKLNKPEKSRELYENALLLNPDDAELHFNLATLISKSFDDKQEAIKHYDLAVEINPDFSEAFYNYSICLVHDFKNYKKAILLLNRALEIEPQNKKYLKSLSRIYESDLKDLVTTKSILDKFITLTNLEAEDYYYYASFLAIHFLPEYRDTAISYYKKSYDISPEYKTWQMDEVLGI